MGHHGRPCWFELSTSDLEEAKAFYGKVLGWEVGPSQMPDFDYRLATAASGGMVAGMMSLDMAPKGTPPNWLVYFAVDGADDAAKKVAALGGKVVKGPADIPNTGRFAVLTDPQGAFFGVLEPAPMTPPPPEDAGAWNQQKAGHGNWLELMSTDPTAGFDFYAALFGWTKGEAMDMGEMGRYQLFKHAGTDIGGMMGLGGAPVPSWLPYFGVDGSVLARIETIKLAGGKVHVGPMEVPGPAFVAVAQDPQGAWFAVVGPTK